MSGESTSTKSTSTKAAAEKAAPATGLHPGGRTREAAPFSSGQTFQVSTITAHQEAYDAARQFTAGKLDPSPTAPAASVVPRVTLPVGYESSEGYRCAPPFVQDHFADFVYEGPVDFTSDNLGLHLHDINVINDVYAWCPGVQVPAGLFLIKSNAIYGPEERRVILGREDVG